MIVTLGDKRKVIFVDPGYGSQGWGSFGSSHWSSIVHHGVCALSAYVKAAGWDTELIDVRKLRSPDEFRARVAAENGAALWAFTCRTLDFNTVTSLVDIVKGEKPDAKTAVGGVHPTILPGDFEGNANVDYIVKGEGEAALVTLLKELESGGAAARHRSGDYIDLDSAPFDDREIYDYPVSVRLANYPGVFEPPMVTMITSRGCPFNCFFCQPAERMVFGKRIRYRAVSRVVEELNLLRDRYHFNSVKYYDDHFLANREWIEEFIGAMGRAGQSKPFLVQTRADAICRNGDLLDDLKRIGLTQVIVGFESGSDRVLKFLKKGTTSEQNVEAGRILHEHGLRIVANIMIGIPTEEKEDVEATIEMVGKIRPQVPSVSFYTPIPGSFLYDYCVEKGLSLVESYDDMLRDPTKPKIKGVDYEYLTRAMDRVMGARFGNALFGRLVATAYRMTKSNLRLRSFLVGIYNRFFNR